MVLLEADCKSEEAQRHFGMFNKNGELLACVIAVSLSLTQSKFRQMAVMEKWQGQGLGRELLQKVEEQLSLEGCENLILNARLSAKNFYEKLGYVSVGDEFYEVGLPHFRMEKRLLKKLNV